MYSAVGHNSKHVYFREESKELVCQKLQSRFPNYIETPDDRYREKTVLKVLPEPMMIVRG